MDKETKKTNMQEESEMIGDSINLLSEERDYLSMIGKLNDTFGNNGWADGYADFPSDHMNLIRQLYGKIPDEDLIEYLDEYLQGYELGCDMSENCEEYYDEDGELSEDKNIDTFSHSIEARELLLKYKKKVSQIEKSENV